MKNLEDLAKFPEENPNPVLRVSKEFVLYANQMGQDLFNIKIGDRIPILLRDITHKTFEENVTKNLEVALNHHFYSLFVTPIKGANYVNIYGMDITERRKKEEEIRLQSEIMTNMSEGVYLVRLEDSFIVYANPRFEEMFGYDPGEMIGKDVVMVNAPTDKTPEETKNEIVGILKDTGEWHGELLNIKKDGTPFWCYANVSLFDHPDYGRVMVAVHTDITERKEKEEEIRLQSEIIESMSEGVYLIKLDGGTIVYTNPAFEEMFGYNPDEMVGKNVAIVNAPTDKTPEETRNEIMGILKDSGEWHGEVLNVKKDGTLFWCYANVSIFDHPEYGSVFVSIHTDITERKRVELKLKESEEKYRDLYESAPNAYLSVKPDKSIIRCNNAAVKLLGYSREELIGMTVFEIYFDSPEGLPKAKKIFKKFLAGKPIQDEELQMRHKNGNPIWVSITVEAVKNQKGQVLESRSMIIDITERKNTEVEIVNLAKFPSENPFPVLRVTKEKILYSNKAGEELFKIKEGSRLPHELLERINRAIDLDTPQLIEVDFAGKIFSFNILSIKDEGYANIYGRDITERRCAEIELQKSEATYREAYNRAEFYKDIFTHDINNILQNISNGIQLNEMYLNRPDKLNIIERNIDIIKRQVKRGANLVSNVRKLSKISESETILFTVNFKEVLTNSINYIKNAFQDKNLKIDVQISEDNFKILANELLEDVFDNILTNSINYNDSEDINIEVKITKELKQGIDYIKMQFIDNGIGITDERKPQIFIRGYSEETSVHGMGLGLSLVKKIIESYNGEIWMEDRVKGDYTKGNNCIILMPEVINND